MLLQGAAAALRRYAEQRLGDVLNLELSSRILDHAATLDLAFFEDPDVAGRALARRQRPGGSFLRFFIAASSAAGSAVLCVALVGVLMWVDWLAAPALVLVAAPFVVHHWRLGRERFALERARTRRQRWAAYYLGHVTRRDLVPGDADPGPRAAARRPLPRAPRRHPRRAHRALRAPGHRPHRRLRRLSDRARRRRGLGGRARPRRLDRPRRPRHLHARGRAAAHRGERLRRGDRRRARGVALPHLPHRLPRAPAGDRERSLAARRDAPPRRPRRASPTGDVRAPRLELDGRLHLSRRRASGARRSLAHDRRRIGGGAGRAQRVGQDHAREAAGAALRSHRGHDPRRRRAAPDSRPRELAPAHEPGRRESGGLRGEAAREHRARRLARLLDDRAAVERIAREAGLDSSRRRSAAGPRHRARARASAPPICRAGSGSASRSRARWRTTPDCSSSTSRPPTSTPKPRRGSTPRCASSHAGAPPCSSRTVSRPSAWPRPSSCSRPADWSSRAATAS